MIVTGRSWIIPMSMVALLTAGCSTVDSVTGIFGSSESSSSGPASKSFVGERAASLGGDLEKLQATRSERADATSKLKGQAAAETAAYNGTVQEIAERLRAGTGPLNQQLLNQWTEARGHLARVDETVSRMRALEADLSGDRARARFLAETAQGLSGVGGATEAEAAKVREVQSGLAEVSRGLDATGNDLGAEIRRHNEWLAAERPRSDTLLAAIRTGNAAPAAEPAAGRTAPLPFAGPSASAAPSGRAAATAAAASAAAVAAPKAPAGDSAFDPPRTDGRKVFVAIRFDRPDVEYEHQLYEALQVAVDRSPKIRFDVVAVTPKKGKFSAKRTAVYARRVMKSMRSMGLSEGQVRTYSRQVDGISEPQVHIYVRRRS